MTLEALRREIAKTRRRLATLLREYRERIALDYDPGDVVGLPDATDVGAQYSPEEFAEMVAQAKKWREDAEAAWGTGRAIVMMPFYEYLHLTAHARGSDATEVTPGLHVSGTSASIFGKGAR